MRTVSRRSFTILAVMMFMLLSALPARADIIVINGVSNIDTDNVLLNPATDQSLVTGLVNGLIVNFSSTSFSGLLSANPSGQATVSGGTGNNPFTDLSFGLNGGLSFTKAVFNINAGTDGDARITVNGININGGFFQSDFVVDANGQNFFTITAINGQSITGINLAAINGATFEDVRQVRLGGGQIPTSPVPEPASMILLGTGLLSAAARRRKKTS